MRISDGGGGGGGGSGEERGRGDQSECDDEGDEWAEGGGEEEEEEKEGGDGYGLDDGDGFALDDVLGEGGDGDEEEPQRMDRRGRAEAEAAAEADAAEMAAAEVEGGVFGPHDPRHPLHQHHQIGEGRPATRGGPRTSRTSAAQPERPHTRGGARSAAASARRPDSSPAALRDVSGATEGARGVSAAGLRSSLVRGREKLRGRKQRPQIATESAPQGPQGPQGTRAEAWGQQEGRKKNTRSPYAPPSRAPLRDAPNGRAIRNAHAAGASAPAGHGGWVA